MLAIGGDGAVGLAAFEMSLDLGCAFVGLLVPEDLAGVAIDTDDMPGVLAGVVD